MEAQTGTKPVSESHAFDTAALQAYLEQHLGQCLAFGHAQRVRSHADDARTGRPALVGDLPRH